MKKYLIINGIIYMKITLKKRKFSLFKKCIKKYS